MDDSCIELTSVRLVLLAVLALGLGLGLGLGLRDSESKRSLVSGQGQTRKPNVLVIMSDDQGTRKNQSS